MYSTVHNVNTVSYISCKLHQILKVLFLWQTNNHYIFCWLNMWVWLRRLAFMLVPQDTDNVNDPSVCMHYLEVFEKVSYICAVGRSLYVAFVFVASFIYLELCILWFLSPLRCPPKWFNYNLVILNEQVWHGCSRMINGGHFEIQDCLRKGLWKKWQHHFFLISDVFWLF